MPKTRLVRHLAYKPQDLLALVTDVERYPDFVNLLSAVRITREISSTPNSREFEAEAVVSYKMINETFRSKVKVDMNAKKVNVTKADRSGAVKSLSNSWIFHELSDGSTLIEFAVDVRLKAFPLELLVRDKFGKASQYIMQLFEDRAKTLYTPVETSGLDLSVEMARLGLSDQLV